MNKNIPLKKQKAITRNIQSYNQRLSIRRRCRLLIARQSEFDTYQRLVTHPQEYLDLAESGEPIIYVPDVTAIKDGKIVGRFEMEYKDVPCAGPALITVITSSIVVSQEFYIYYF